VQLKCDVIIILLRLTRPLAVKDCKQATLRFAMSRGRDVPFNHSITARPISLKLENSCF